VFSVDTWKNPGKEHGNGYFVRSTSITYSGCSNLVYGYDDSRDLDKRISTSSSSY
jgi:hypothetical protein